MLAVHFRHTGLGVYRLLVQYSIFFYQLFPFFSNFTLYPWVMLRKSQVYLLGKDSVNVVYNLVKRFKGYLEIPFSLLLLLKFLLASGNTSS